MSSYVIPHASGTGGGFLNLNLRRVRLSILRTRIRTLSFLLSIIKLRWIVKRPTVIPACSEGCHDVVRSHGQRDTAHLYETSSISYKYIQIKPWHNISIISYSLIKLIFITCKVVSVEPNRTVGNLPAYFNSRSHVFGPTGADPSNNTV